MTDPIEAICEEMETWINVNFPDGLPRTAASARVDGWLAALDAILGARE